MGLLVGSGPARHDAVAKWPHAKRRLSDGVEATSSRNGAIDASSQTTPFNQRPVYSIYRLPELQVEAARATVRLASTARSGQLAATIRSIVNYCFARLKVAQTHRHRQGARFLKPFRPKVQQDIVPGRRRKH